jgi:transcriptional regulator CtsR
MKQKLYILLLISTFSFAQKVETKIDKTTAKIGSQINYILKTTVDTATVVKFPAVKNFGAFEVIRSYKIDTIDKDDKYELIKKYGLTQFDSGRYVIPKMPILFGKIPAYSDTISVHITDVAVDTLKQKMFDIKPIANEDSKIGNWWKWVLGILLVVGIAALIYYLIKRNQDRKLNKIEFKTPIEKAVGMLQLLEKKQLWQKGEVKNYYVELTDIAREYIEEVVEIPAKESTTAELIAAMKKAVVDKKLKLNSESVLALEKVLKQADLVKFAKVLPQDFEITNDQKSIESSIISVHKSIPTEADEDIVDVLAEKEKLRLRQKRNRIIYTVLIVFFLLFATFIYLIATKGFDFVKDNIVGHPTKELLEDEWVYSEYGESNIGIETPKVLKRFDMTSQIPPQMKELLKSNSMFQYGSLIDNFQVAVLTFTLKQAANFDLDKGVDGSVQGYAKTVGATILSIDKNDFETKNGIKGKIAFGLFEITDPIKKLKIQLKYQFLYFANGDANQQVMVVYNANDNYGDQISKRIINSIELKTENK